MKIQIDIQRAAFGSVCPLIADLLRIVKRHKYLIGNQRKKSVEAIGKILTLIHEYCIISVFLPCRLIQLFISGYDRLPLYLIIFRVLFCDLLPPDALGKPKDPRMTRRYRHPSAVFGNQLAEWSAIRQKQCPFVASVCRKNCQHGFSRSGSPYHCNSFRLSDRTIDARLYLRQFICRRNFKCHSITSSVL